MVNININAKGSSLIAQANGNITSGMVGIGVNLEYDEQWSGLNKTAFFKCGNLVRKRDGVGVYTTVPWEVLRNHGKNLQIGIEGRDLDGNIVMPTVWASVGLVHEGANGEIPAAPNPNSENIVPSGTIIDDSDISPTKTWSSKKISDEISKSAGIEPNALNLYHLKFQQYDNVFSLYSATDGWQSAILNVKDAVVYCTVLNQENETDEVYHLSHVYYPNETVDEIIFYFVSAKQNTVKTLAIDYYGDVLIYEINTIPQIDKELIEPGYAADAEKVGDRFDAIETTIGDISTALDELHAYAEALKGGETT